MHSEASEVWVIVPSSQDYEVSDLGRVRRRTPARGTWPGRILNPYTDGDGYLRVNILGSSPLVHAIVAEAFIGSRPEGADVCHRNGSSEDNRLVNLRYGTRLENETDKTRHGTRYQGSRHWRAVLTEGKVREVRERRSRGESLESLSLEFGVSISTLSMAANRKTWRHV